MRVLHVLPTGESEYGGPVRVAEAFCTQLVRRGHSAQVFSPPPGGGISRRLAYWPGIAGLRSLRESIRGADLVHVHGLWTVPTSAAATIARTSGRPFVITPHGMLDRWSLQHHGRRKRLYAAAIERRNLDAAAALHFFNAEERDEAQAFGVCAPAFLLPNGVDPEEFDALPGREALVGRHPEIGDRVIVLFLGRLHPKKGLPLLIEALSRLALAGMDIHLVVAGPDEVGHRAEIEAQIERFQLRDRVLLAGPAFGEDKRCMLGAADVFVLSSFQEGDSVAVKEALAARLPVVITRACHFPEIAEEGAGLVIEPNAGELSEALRRLCADKRLRHDMASRARGLIERSYRWDVLGSALVGHYERVLARYADPMRATVGSVG